MANPRTRTPRQGTSARRGDFTGVERDRLTQEKADEVAEAQQRVGLMNTVQRTIEEEGVFDPQSQALVEGPQGLPDDLDGPIQVDDPNEVIDASTDPAATKRAQPSDPFKDLRDPVTQQAPHHTLPSRAVEVDEVQDQGYGVLVVEPETEVIMVNTDIEDMTYGAGNNYTFVQGRKYRVPKEVADWLDAKDYLYHGRR